MSLMKTGRLHNDPYCFRGIEEYMPELKPAGWRGALDGLAAPEMFRRLGRFFSGGRTRGGENET
jgi:hypothetical protein